jgi:hypothetical protein
VEVAFGAETLDTPDNGGAGEALGPQALDYGLVQRLAMPGVRLADEDAQKHPLTRKSHRAIPAIVPSHTATKPAVTDPTRLAKASAMAPPRSSCMVSYVKVENVV